MDNNIMKHAEPFLFPGNRTGCLLVHGFTGTPAELRLLGEQLAQCGFTVLGVRLAGHGTTPQDMRATDWQRWYDSVQDGYHLLRGCCEQVYVVGLSMGGLLSCLLAAKKAVDKLVLLSTPISLYNPRLKWLWLYRMIKRYEPKPNKRYRVDQRYQVHYELTPVRAVHSFLNLLQETKANLAQITCPTLIMQSKAEHTVRPESAQFIYDQIGSHDKRLIWLKKSGHIITLDKEHEQVNQTVQEFLLEVTADDQ